MSTREQSENICLIKALITKNFTLYFEFKNNIK